MGTTAALAIVGLVGVATPAYADDRVGLLVGPANLDMRPGESRDITATVENKDEQQRTISVTVQVPGEFTADLTVRGKSTGCVTEAGTSANCTIDFAAKQKRELLFTLVAKSTVSVPAGSSKSGSGTVTAQVTSGPGEEKASYNVKLAGPAQQAPTGVPEVSGAVTDSTTGKPVAGATVVMQDGAGKSRTGTSTSTGTFRFTSSGAEVISPGTITISAGKDMYDNATSTHEGRAGQALSGIKVRLLPLAATASQVPPPSAVDEASADGTDAGDTGAADTNPTSGSGSGFSWILIVLGALLVLFGIGAIVLLMRRGKDDDDDGDDDDGDYRRGPPPGGPGQRPMYRGAPNADPTMVSRTAAMGAPAMAGRGNDATAIVRPPRAVDPYVVPPDPYAAPPDAYGAPQDPYGAPADPYAAPPRTGGYGPAGPAGPGGYGAGPGAGGYGVGGDYGNQPGPGGGGGYGPSSRPAAEGYSASDYAEGGYGAGYGGGQQRGGYGEDGTRRYEPPAAPPPPADYGAQPYAGRESYDARGGYEPAAGYERDGYERVPEPPRAAPAYDQRGYDERGGYYGDEGAGGAPNRQNPPPRGGDRRSLDWLDD